MRPIDIAPSLYSQQLEAKRLSLIDQFQDIHDAALEVMTSAPLHYRMRAEFRVWHEGEDLYQVMFDQETREKYRVDAFPPGSILINQVMQALISSPK